MVSYAGTQFVRALSAATVVAYLWHSLTLRQTFVCHCTQHCHTTVTVTVHCDCQCHKLAVCHFLSVSRLRLVGIVLNKTSASAEYEHNRRRRKFANVSFNK